VPVVSTGLRTRVTVAYVRYQSRIVDEEVGRLLESTGAGVLEGPKAAGKTETVRQRAASSVLLDVDAGARQLARS